MSCGKKENEGNKGVIKTENIEVSVTENKYRYVATDGSSTHVSFINENGKEKISVHSNNKTINADLESKEGAKSIYKNGDIIITSDGDLVNIEQGGQIIELKKARGQ